MHNVDGICSPAIITPTPVRLIDNGSESILSLDDRIYTSALLVDLATPDFSMPYNVIIFDCLHLWFCFQCFGAKASGIGMEFNELVFSQKAFDVVL